MIEFPGHICALWQCGQRMLSQTLIMKDKRADLITRHRTVKRGASIFRHGFRQPLLLLPTPIKHRVEIWCLQKKQCVERVEQRRIGTL